MNLQGRIKYIGQTQVVGQSGFQKREVVITTEEQYPQYIMVEFHQDKCPILDNYQIGQMVEIAINLRGREWVNPQGETKYFNSIVGWRIKLIQIQSVSNQGGVAPAQPQPTQSFETINEVNEGNDDDLPF